MADGTSLRGVGSAEGRSNFRNEDLPNNFILSGGTVTFPMEFGSNSKDVWLAGNVSSPGGLQHHGLAPDLVTFR